jgi:hypothetical protein
MFVVVDDLVWFSTPNYGVGLREPAAAKASPYRLWRAMQIALFHIGDEHLEGMRADGPHADGPLRMSDLEITYERYLKLAEAYETIRPQRGWSKRDWEKPTGELLSVNEAAKLCGLPRLRIMVAINRGELEGFRHGGPQKVRPEALRAWLGRTGDRVKALVARDRKRAKMEPALKPAPESKQKP